MQLDDLSPAELAIIQQRRNEQQQRDVAFAFQRKAIATAHQFAEWSAASGYGLTFSTFVNQFDYQDADGRAMYAAVARIMDAALPQ